MSLALCIVAAFVTYYLGRRSLVAGLLSLFAIGYAYGILRANLQSTAIYFLSSIPLLSGYTHHNWPTKRQFLSPDGQRLKHWVLLLTLWPIVLFFVPLQDPLIQVVGLRGNIFFPSP